MISIRLHEAADWEAVWRMILPVFRSGVTYGLWQKHGFQIIGTIPLAYRHAEHGYVDAYIMYKSLLEPSQMPVNEST